MPAGPPAVALTIAGSDASGGAGVQADLKTFHAYGVYGMSAITAVTAQNTSGVEAVQRIRPEIVAAQIDAVVSDIRPATVKTGMLASAATAAQVADAIQRHGLEQLVIDPVMIATSGDRLLDGDAIEVLLARLMPLATLITPNASEAATLTGRPVETPADQADAARHIVEELGTRAVLVTGGDIEGREVFDIYYDGDRLEVFRDPRIETTNTHGSGCALAAAITAGLALGQSLDEAVLGARAWVRHAIATAPGLGRGRGPLNLFG